MTFLTSSPSTRSSSRSFYPFTLKTQAVWRRIKKARANCSTRRNCPPLTSEARDRSGLRTLAVWGVVSCALGSILVWKWGRGTIASTRAAKTTPWSSTSTSRPSSSTTSRNCSWPTNSAPARPSAPSTSEIVRPPSNRWAFYASGRAQRTRWVRCFWGSCNRRPSSGASWRAGAGWWPRCRW